jgi:ribose transport system substrate-binding protein
MEPVMRFIHARLLSFGIAASAIIVLAGCGPKGDETKPAGPVSSSTTSAPSPPAGSKGTIGVSLLTNTNPFFTDMGDAMKAEAKKHNYDIILEFGDQDAAKQRDQVKDFIVKKVSAIILSPCDSRAVGTTIQEANKAGIPVFTADIASMDKAAKVESHTATDNYAGGKLAAQAIIEAIGGKGKVAIIDHPEVESVIQRTKGFKEVIGANKDITIVADLPGHGERDTSFKTAQDILEKNPDLNAFFCINDPTALGAVAAIEKAGRSGKVKVIGFDGMLEAKQAVKQGKIYADIIQFPDKIGAQTIDEIAAYMAGDKPQPQTLISAQIYKKSEADADPKLK